MRHAVGGDVVSSVTEIPEPIGDDTREVSVKATKPAVPSHWSGCRETGRRRRWSRAGDNDVAGLGVGGGAARTITISVTVLGRLRVGILHTGPVVLLVPPSPKVHARFVSSGGIVGKATVTAPCRWSGAAKLAVGGTSARHSWRPKVIHSIGWVMVMLELAPSDATTLEYSQHIDAIQ